MRRYVAETYSLPYDPHAEHVAHFVILDNEATRPSRREIAFCADRKTAERCAKALNDARDAEAVNARHQ